MRQTHVSTVELCPGDSVIVTHTITVKNDTDETVGFAGLKWEPIWTTGTSAEVAAYLEREALAELT